MKTAHEQAKICKTYLEADQTTQRKPDPRLTYEWTHDSILEMMKQYMRNYQGRRGMYSCITVTYIICECKT